MEYELRNNALPTYYRRSVDPDKFPLVVSESCTLGSEPITALHYHNGFEIGLCISGEGDTHIGERLYKHKAGCIAISRAYQPHLSTNRQNEQGAWTWISIDTQALLTSVGMTDPEVALRLIRACEAVTGVFLPGELPDVENAVNTLINTAKRKDEHSDFALRIAAAQVLTSFSLIPEKFKDKDVNESLIPAITRSCPP